MAKGLRATLSLGCTFLEVDESLTGRPVDVVGIRVVESDTELSFTELGTLPRLDQLTKEDGDGISRGRGDTGRCRYWASMTARQHI